MSAPASLEQRFAPFADRMRAAGAPPASLAAFRRQYGRLLAGETGFISGEVAGPVGDLPDLESLEDRRGADAEAMDRLALIKLNGGLGTSMGLSGPKSLIPVRGDRSFLDIIVEQVLEQRRQSGARLPLILMNSFNTRAGSLAALAHHPEIDAGLPLDFLQGKVPKVRASDLTPAEWPEAPEREWCPPGHGDLYGSLAGSGLLDRLIAEGFDLAFVSNADNLGATADPALAGYMRKAGLPFLMEVARRTVADRKGGHLGRRPDGQLVLRELAQCPPEEREAFQDIQRYRYFNTNNLWIHLPSLADLLAQGEGYLDLPLIRNEKPVDPTRPESPRVYQLETAMGSAIEVFEGAAAVRVPRRRFLPVKKTGDLLAMRSDAYCLREDGRLELAPEREGRPPEVLLDEIHYRQLDDLALRFPEGPPSLRRCERLEVEGDVRFGRDVIVTGHVELRQTGDQPLFIADGRRLEGRRVGQPV